MQQMNSWDRTTVLHSHVHRFFWVFPLKRTKLSLRIPNLFVCLFLFDCLTLFICLFIYFSLLMCRQQRKPTQTGGYTNRFQKSEVSLHQPWWRRENLLSLARQKDFEVFPRPQCLFCLAFAGHQEQILPWRFLCWWFSMKDLKTNL